MSDGTGWSGYIQRRVGGEDEGTGEYKGERAEYL